MNEDFVSIDIAKKLKEKGFPLYQVWKQDKHPIFYDLSYEHPNYQDCKAWYIPTIAKALKMLRDNTKIHILIATYHHQPENIHNWGYDIIDIIKHESIHYNSGYDSYEEAAIAGIEFFLDNILSTKK